MGRVLLSRDPVLNRDVAIKILRDDLGLPPEVREGLIVRMKHEAQAAARVSHPNLVTLHDMGQDPVVGLFLVFEYVNGPNLKERIRSGRLPPQQAARLARELGQALAVAHLSGVLHRDIKPENIMLASTGAKISDFGIARIPDSTLTRTGSLIGTPAYCAPEALTSGYFSPESDQFSLAATLYEAISGERAFPGEDAVGVAAKIQTEEPRPIARRSNLPDEIDEILLRAMAKEPRERFASTAELGEVLAAALERSSVSVPLPRGSLSSMPSGRVPLPEPPARNGARTALGGAVLLFVGGLVGYAASRGQPLLQVTPDVTPYLPSASSSASEAPSSKPAHKPRQPGKPTPHPPDPRSHSAPNGSGPSERGSSQPSAMLAPSAPPPAPSASAP
jgi:serine/threonine-protein kinase